MKKFKFWKWIKKTINLFNTNKTLKDINENNNEFKKKQTEKFNKDSLDFISKIVQDTKKETKNEYFLTKVKYQVHENKFEVEFKKNENISLEEKDNEENKITKAITNE